MIPAPSPMTKPSRSRSNGREAFVGSSLRVESALRALKPLTPIGVMVASLPPASIAVACPSWIQRAAEPMQWLPVAQAVTTLSLGPFRPNCIET